MPLLFPDKDVVPETGLIDVSRVAHGHRFQQTYEIYGNRGAIAFDNDNASRLRVTLTSEARDGVAQWRVYSS